jgi:phage shock protein E
MRLQKILPFLMLMSFVLVAIRFWIARRRLSRKPIPKDAIIVDVRTSREFESGHAPNSRNIPLDRLESELKTLDSSKPIVVCCASGMRSAQAFKILRSNGFKSIQDVGSWRNV